MNNKTFKFLLAGDKFMPDLFTIYLQETKDEYKKIK